MGYSSDGYMPREPAWSTHLRRRSEERGDRVFPPRIQSGGLGKADREANPKSGNLNARYLPRSTSTPRGGRSTAEAAAPSWSTRCIGRGSVTCCAIFV